MSYNPVAWPESSALCVISKVLCWLEGLNSSFKYFAVCEAELRLSVGFSLLFHGSFSIWLLTLASTVVVHVCTKSLQSCVTLCYPLDCSQPGSSVCVCVCMCAKLLLSCPTPWDPMDCNLPGSSVCEILQARTLERVAISFSRGSFQPRDGTGISSVSCFGR